MNIRRWILFLSFFLLPITLNYFSPVLVIQAGFEKTFTIMHIVFGLMCLSAVFFGAAWCAYICPYGSLQELLPSNNLKNTINKPKLRYIKIVLGVLFLGLIIAPIISNGFQKSIMFYHMEDTKVAIDSLHSLIRYYIITVSIIIITITFGKRFWCRYICPMYIFNYIGIKIGRLFKIPSLKISSRKENCTHCGICNNVCMMGLDVKKMINNNQWNKDECIMCGECLRVCKKNVMEIRWER